MRKNQSDRRTAAILLIAAGYGWAGGHYIPADAPIFAYFFQWLILLILLILSIKYFSLPENERLSPNWSTRGISIFSSLSLLINIANIVHGVYASDNNSFGSHNTFADLVPVTLIIIGTTSWLTTLSATKKITE